MICSVILEFILIDLKVENTYPAILPIYQPSAEAPRPKTRLSPIYKNAEPILSSNIKRKLSALNVEKVVNPPQNPAANSR